jgi:Bacterial SH3 domain
VLSVARALVVAALLAIPLLVVANLQHLFDIAGSVPSVALTPVTVSTPFRLPDPTPPSKSGLTGLDQPPPTLAPAPTATLAPRPTPTGERIVVNNTNGQGAVLRSEPVSGKQIASLREQAELTVLERRTLPGQGEWLRVRTSEGLEGWVLALVSRPVAPARP